MIKGEQDFLNYLKTPIDWEYAGKYDAPVLKPFEANIEDFNTSELVDFHEAHRLPMNKRKDKIIHFFLSDYLIQRTWGQAKNTRDFLSSFGVCLTPDFSIYVDMPKSMGIFNHYRKQWVGRYWQDLGMNVIPTICWSDESSYEYCFDGIPKKSLVALSSVGVIRDKEAMRLFEQGYNKMLEVLEPSQIILFGKMPEFITDKSKIISVEHSRHKHFKELAASKENNNE